MNKSQIQQGDVLLRVVPSLPKGCKKLSHRMLALGEHTGHHHSFSADCSVALMEAPDGTVFAINEGDEPAALIHQEHNSVVLQPGEAAEFGQVREFDWFRQMERTVKD